MRIKEATERLGLSAADIEELELDPVQIIVDAEFRRKSPLWKPDVGKASRQKDYRERAVTRLIKNRISFSSENNIFGEVAKLGIALKCPVCHGPIDGQCDGGAFCGPIGGMTFAGNCSTCKLRVAITLPPNGISVTFESPYALSAEDLKGVPVPNDCKKCNRSHWPSEDCGR